MALADVLEELIAREPIFHRPELGTDFENMIAPDFWEIGASGCQYRREYILAELKGRQINPQQDVWEASDFHCRKLCDTVYLLTYTLLQNKERKTRRSTIWERADNGWKILFHQGTIVQES